MHLVARDIMNRELIRVDASATLDHALSTILQHRVRNLPVVDDKGRYLGLIGMNSIIRALLPRAVTLEGGLTSAPFAMDSLGDLRERFDHARSHPVTEFLEEDQKVLEPDTPLIETILDLYHNKGSLPVVDKGMLVGMVSSVEVLGRFAGRTG